MSDMLICEVAEGIATLTLNRPEHRNAMPPELVAELTRALRDAGRDPQVKCIVLRGAGEHFSAGGDVKGFNEALTLTAAERHELFERRVLLANRLPSAVIDCPKPVLVLAQGAAAGVGLGLCLAADLVLAGESAYFLAAHVHVGLALDCGLSSLLVAAMGIKAAKRIALLGERISSQQALGLGIVNEVVPDAELAERGLALARRLASGPATAMAASKASLNRAAHPEWVGLLVQEAQAVARCVADDDFREGVEATLQRRPPAFGRG